MYLVDIEQSYLEHCINMLFKMSCIRWLGHLELPSKPKTDQVRRQDKPASRETEVLPPVQLTMSPSEIVDVDIDEAKCDVEDGSGLETLGLATCIGIGLTGKYDADGEPGEERCDKFLAHLADSPQMEETWDEFKMMVDEAKQVGLVKLRVLVCVPDASTLADDDEFNWTEDMILKQGELYNYYVALAQKLASGIPGSSVKVDKHHFKKPRNMTVTSKDGPQVSDSYETSSKAHK